MDVMTVPESSTPTVASWATLRTKAFRVVAALACSVAVLTDKMPLFNYPPGRDSGVFLYAANIILDGGVPYRDVWDHKPPGIYFVDALGLWLGFGTTWGVWLLEVVSLSVAVLCCYVLLQRVLGMGAAVAGTASLVGNAILLLSDGNYTEEFGLPFQLAAILLFYGSRFAPGGPRQTLHALAIGACIGSLALLKPNLVGVGVAIAIYLLVEAASVRKWSENLKYAALLVAGATLPILAAFVYFAANSALSDLWEQVVVYNVQYSVTSLQARIEAIGTGLHFLLYTGTALFAVAAWVGCAVALAARKIASPGVRVLCGLVMAGLPVELLMVGISGRYYFHYYLALLPICAMACGLFYYALMLGLQSFLGNRPRIPLLSTAAKPRIVAILIVAVSLTLPINIALTASEIVAPSAIKADGTSATHRLMQMEAVQYIDSHTSPGEPVLVWGAEVGVNVAAQRAAPTRFVYQLPLFTEAYSRPADFERLLSDLIAKPPALIIDASASTEEHLLPPLGAEARSTWAAADPRRTVRPDVQPVFRYVEEHYVRRDNTGANRWPVYALRGTEALQSDRALSCAAGAGH